MSHIAKVDVEIKDLTDLAAACKHIGLELVLGQTDYRWYGASVGDYPLPEGFHLDDLGKCDHAIRIPLDHPFHESAEQEPYEIGVVKRRDGGDGYLLLWDFYQGGCGLNQFVGGSEYNHDGQMPKLKQAYAFEATKRVAQAQGFRLSQQVQANGTIKMILTR